MKYKKIYIEITNACNLNCSFCPQNTRKKQFLSFADFSYILDKIKGYTRYIYLHVMGEPLLHPQINEFICLAHKKGFYINITTNGYLLNKIKKAANIRQINLSLHSYSESYGLSLDEYLNTIFQLSDEFAKRGTYINYRLWTNSTISSCILKKIDEKYNTILSYDTKTQILAENIFYSKEQQFVWPIERVEKGDFFHLKGCRALKDHIAILVDGTVVPCCMDNDAHIVLGNIYKDDLAIIIESCLYQTILAGFYNNKKVHPFCQKCDFYAKKKTK